MNPTDRKRILKSVDDLIQSVVSLVDTMASTATRAARNGAKATGRRGGARGAWTAERKAKLRRSIAAYWAGLTPAQHRQRVKKMLAGRGIKRR